MDNLVGTPQYALQKPRILTEDSVLWMNAGQAQLREFYGKNLEKKISELLQDGDMITVSDDALPSSSLNFTIRYSKDEQ